MEERKPTPTEEEFRSASWLLQLSVVIGSTVT